MTTIDIDRDIHTWLERARASASEQRFDEAREALDAAEHIAEESASPRCDAWYYQAKSQVHDLAGERDDATSWMKGAGMALRQLVISEDDLESTLEFAANRLEVAERLDDDGDCAQAASILDESISRLAVRKEPECIHPRAEAAVNRAVYLTHLGRDDEALLAANQSLDLHDDCDECHDERANALGVIGELHGRFGRCADAVDAYRRAFEDWETCGHDMNCRNVTRFRMMFATELRHVGAFDDAIVEFQRVTHWLDTEEHTYPLAEQAGMHEELGMALEECE